MDSLNNKTLSEENQTIAALLHDIGKVYYRITGKNHSNDTKEFIRKRILSNNGKNDEEGLVKAILDVIEKHHDKDEKRAYIFYKIADWISAFEREGKEEEREKGISVINIPLKNPFNEEVEFKTIKLSDFFNIPLYFQSLIDRKREGIELSLNARGVVENNKDILKEELKDLFSYINNIEKSKDFIKNWILLMDRLERLTSFIPSAAFKDEPNISLFDHLKTTAMFYYLLKTSEDIKEKEALIVENVNNLSDILNNNDLKNIKLGKFVQLDLSGIQNFIFSIYEKRKTTDLLKARSLYLELLLYLIVLDFFREEKIPLTQVLLLTAGKAQLLLPKEKAEKLKKRIKEINRELFKKFRNNIFISYGEMDFTFDHLRKEKFKEDFREKVEKENLQNKLRKNEDSLEEWNKELIDENYLEKYKKCDFCLNFYEERDFINEKEKIIPLIGENSDKKVCKYCYAFYKLGQIMKKSEKVKKEELTFKKIIKGTETEERKEEKDVFPIFEGIIKENLINEIGNIKLSFFEKESGGQSKLQNKNQSENNKNNDVIKSPFSVHYPLKDEEKGSKIKTTEDLAKIDNNEETLLALIKLDVDNLGKVLYDENEKKGKEERNNENNNENDLGNSNNWSVIAFRSRILNYFFTYYVPYMIKSNEKYKDFIYLIFSGGDDNLLFGRADVVLDFLIDLRKAFKKLFGEKVTFSSSYVIFKPKENLRLVAEKAEELLDEAKKWRGEIKNVLNLNGICIKWEEIEKNIEGIKQDLDDKIKEIFKKEESNKVEDKIKKLVELTNDQKFIDNLSIVAIVNELLNQNEEKRMVKNTLIYRLLNTIEKNIIYLDNLKDKETGINVLNTIRFQYYINRNLKEFKDFDFFGFIENEEKKKETIGKIVSNNNNNKEDVRVLIYILLLLSKYSSILRKWVDGKSSMEEIKKEFIKFKNLIKLGEIL